eukprot:13901787-Alexandrium_andersonii.AAC.1
MSDVTLLLRECRPLIGAPPLTSTDVEFADDTVLLSTTPSGTELLLRLLEVEAMGVRPPLQQAKTCHLSVNSGASLSFADGSPVPKAGSVKYLGVVISSTGGYDEEVARRIASAASAFAMLRPLWRTSRVPRAQKIL